MFSPSHTPEHPHLVGSHMLSFTFTLAWVEATGTQILCLPTHPLSTDRKEWPEQENFPSRAVGTAGRRNQGVGMFLGSFNLKVSEFQASASGMRASRAVRVQYLLASLLAPYSNRRTCRVLSLPSCTFNIASRPHPVFVDVGVSQTTGSWDRPQRVALQVYGPLERNPTYMTSPPLGTEPWLDGSKTTKK